MTFSHRRLSTLVPVALFSESCSCGFTTFSKGGWIVHSGATCHMSNEESSFCEIKQLSTSQDVTLGGGRTLKGTAIGTVELNISLPDGNKTKCTLNNVPLVPKLSYSLLSASKAASTGKVIKFDNKGCEIVNSEERVIAFATQVGNLYHLKQCRQCQSVNSTSWATNNNSGIDGLVILVSRIFKKLQEKSW